MRKLAACVALPILSIPGIAILSGGAAAHMRALLAHTYAAHIAFVQLEAVVARTCGDWCVVSAENRSAALANDAGCFACSTPCFCDCQ